MKTLELDIKYLLSKSPKTRLRWRAIRDGVYENYKEKYPNPYSFNVTLHRALARLLREGDIKKEEVGHQEVFYSIPKSRQGKIEEELQKEYVYKTFDDIWDMLTPEQRKKTVQNLSQQGQSIALIIREMIVNLTAQLKEWIGQSISELENPSERLKEKYPPEQRAQFLRELHNLREACEKSGINARNKIQDIEEEVRVRVNLIQEFITKVVEPKYSGDWNVAFMDLMRKAVEEQKTGVKP